MASEQTATLLIGSESNVDKFKKVNVGAMKRRLNVLHQKRVSFFNCFLNLILLNFLI